VVLDIVLPKLPARPVHGTAACWSARLT
jgi:hypothetical protein